jgi:hypothetical protein
MLGVMRSGALCAGFSVVYPQNHQVPWLLHKVELDDLLVYPQNQHDREGQVKEKASSSRLSQRQDPEVKDLRLEAWRGNRVTYAGFFQWFIHKSARVPWLRLKAKSGGSALRKRSAM